jgi:hypothetical protein
LVISASLIVAFRTGLENAWVAMQRSAIEAKPFTPPHFNLIVARPAYGFQPRSAFWQRRSTP